MKKESMKNILLSIALCLAVLPASAQINRAAVEQGIEKSNNLIAAHDWSAAFTTLRGLDAAIGEGSPELHYLVSKQRYSMYSRINRVANAKEHLAIMEELAKRSGDNATIEDMLLTKGAYNSRIGSTQESRQCYKAYFNRRAKNAKDDDAMEKCFKQTIELAKQKQDANMTAMVNQLYTAWQDSIAGVRSANALKELQDKYDAALEDIDSKDGKITIQWAAITTLAIIAIALAAALAFLAFIYMRNMLTTKKLRQSLSIANASNDQKSVFIRNISKQISPSLEQIAAGNGKQHIPALRTMLKHVEEYMEIETSREEKLETDNVNIATFCEEMAAKADVNGKKISVDKQMMSFPLNKETASKLINDVLHELAIMNGTESLSLGFKKRNPHTGQFVITALGLKLQEEERDSLFTAFAKIHDLTVTDGLILPICSIMAYKMNGSLSLDPEFVRGTRVIFEVHC